MFPITFLFLLAILAFGVLAAVVVGIVVALINQRPALGAMIGGVGLVGLLALGMLVVAPLEIAAGTGDYSGSLGTVSWGFAGLRVLIVATVIGLALTMLWRHTAADEPSGGGRGWWRTLLVPPLLLLLLLGTVRIERTTTLPTPVPPHIAEMNPKLASMGIQALMDQADAPRIVLAPERPVAPAAPAEAAALVPGKTASADTSTEAPEEPQTQETDSSDARAPSAAGGATSQSEATEHPPSSGHPTRPAWVDEIPKRVGNTQREVIVTDEYATVEECYQAADIYLQFATYDHLARLVGLRNYADGTRPNVAFHLQQPDGRGYDSRLDALGSMGVGVDYIRREIARDEYVQTVERSFGPMKKLYTLIEFSPAVDRELRHRWQAYRRQDRFAAVGLGAASVLCLLGMVWALLKVDTMTKGYYTKRLFLGVPLGILAAFGLLLLFMESIGGHY